MSNKADCIIKSGIVESIGDKYIKVKIQNQSACSMCYSKGVCTSLSSGERIIEVERDNGKIVLPGDKVEVEMVSSSGWLAVVMAYVIPFILLISTLIILNEFASESIAAIASLSVLAPYYFILHLYRNRMKKYFRFTITQVDSVLM
jgi:sigma-E factor negative regulatory protein RseC